MAPKLIHKKSTVASKVPLATDLEQGELAVNLTDQKIYSKDGSNSVVVVGEVNAAGGNADTLDNLDSTQFLRGDAVDDYYRITQQGHGVPYNNLGSPSITEMALFQEQFNNKTEFYNITNLKFYTSTDGTNWTEYTSFSDTDKRKFLGGDSSSNVLIPNGTDFFRIELTNSGSYVYLNSLYMYWSGQGNTTTVKIRKQRGDGVWSQHTNSSATVSSWPGHLYLPFSTIAFHPSTTSTGHYRTVHIDFEPTWNASYTNPIHLYRMQLWGGYPAGKRTLYAVDEYGNATFPNDLRVNNSSSDKVFSDSYHPDADKLNGYDTTAVGNRWGVIPVVGSDGVMEVGKYIDFHETDGDTSDNSLRLYSNSGVLTSSGNFQVSGNIIVSGTVDGRDVASDGSKLDGIESGATADQTASEILTALKTVDGPGSGLDADTLNGLQSGAIALRANGSIYQHPVWDNRSSNTSTDLGQQAVAFEFKNNTTDGLADGGSYHGVMTFQQWSDSSGGNTNQLAFTDNGNLWTRGAPIGGLGVLGEKLGTMVMTVQVLASMLIS